MALIDRDALIDFIDCGHLRNPLERCFSERDVVNMLEARPEVDAVPVVRCGECKYCLIDLSERKSHICMLRSVLRHRVCLDGYCSYGERMDAEGGDEG